MGEFFAIKHISLNETDQQGHTEGNKKTSDFNDESMDYICLTEMRAGDHLRFNLANFPQSPSEQVLS